MSWLALTDSITGSAVEEVAEEVATQVSNNIEDVVEQTNIFVDYLHKQIPNLIDFGINIIFAILILLIGKKLICVVRKFIKKSLEKADADLGVIQFLDAVVKFVLYFLLFVIIIGRFGVEASSMMAVVGSAGLAVGLALQGSLSNFAGGVLILVLKPFRVGDYIIAGQEGTVKEIHVFYTTLLTNDNRTIFMPNGDLANSNIINTSSQEKRRLEMAVGIGYSADLKKAKELLTQLVEQYEKRVPEDEYSVFVSSLDESAVTLGIHVWVKKEDYLASKWFLNEHIKLEFDKAGIEIPFNQLDVHVKND